MQTEGDSVTKEPGVHTHSGDPVTAQARYENDRDFSVLMKCLPALAFVPEDDVITVFEELVLTLPQEPEVEEVVAYFESNYIRGMQIGFHNALKSVYMCAHPTMWKFLKGIARDIAVQRLVHQNALVHRRDAPTNKYIKLAQRLATKIKMYRAEVDKLLSLTLREWRNVPSGHSWESLNTSGITDSLPPQQHDATRNTTAPQVSVEVKADATLTDTSKSLRQTVANKSKDTLPQPSTFDVLCNMR
ncbi:hypothetical protein O3P69_013270 [Scylla paramamosain]|uniref:Uncharacterized protein n=1 Tax=Scylla paramamosain TaxID=85552 RepID=A0AAW0TZD0_SCYPA